MTKLRFALLPGLRMAFLVNAADYTMGFRHLQVPIYTVRTLKIEAQNKNPNKKHEQTHIIPEMVILIKN